LLWGALKTRLIRTM